MLTDSDRQVSDLGLTLLPGGRNPLHYQMSYSETFTAIDGEAGVGLGRIKKRILEPGNSCTVEHNNLHYFFNPTEKEIKFKTEIKPGHEGFENSLRILYGLAEDGLTKEAYIATGVVIAYLVDFTRLSVYTSRFNEANLHEYLILIIFATIAAIAGAFIGSKLLKKITLRFIQVLVAVMLVVIALALGAGII